MRSRPKLLYTSASARVQFYFLSLPCFPYRLVFDNKSSSELRHKTKRHKRPNHSHSHPHCLLPSSFLSSSSSFLVSCPRTTPADANPPAERSLFLPHFSLLYTYNLSLFNPDHRHLRFHHYYTKSGHSLMAARMYMGPPSCSSRRASRSITTFLPLPPLLTRVFPSLGTRLVELRSTRLNRSPALSLFSVSTPFSFLIFLSC